MMVQTAAHILPFTSMHTIAVLLALAILIQGCSSEEGERVAQEIDRLMSTYDGAVPGASVLVVRDGNGKVLLKTPHTSATAELHGLARRIAMHVDENIDSTLQVLGQL